MSTQPTPNLRYLNENPELRANFLNSLANGVSNSEEAKAEIENIRKIIKIFNDDDVLQLKNNDPRYAEAVNLANTYFSENMIINYENIPNWSKYKDYVNNPANYETIITFLKNPNQDTLPNIFVGGTIVGPIVGTSIPGTARTGTATTATTGPAMTGPATTATAARTRTARTRTARTARTARTVQSRPEAVRVVDVGCTCGAFFCAIIKLVFEVFGAVGGGTFITKKSVKKATKKRFTYKGKSRVVYVGKRGGEYIKMNGRLISTKKLS